MSIYQLAPSPSVAIPEIPFATWINGYTEEDLNKIITICDKYTLNEATLGGGSSDSKIRKTKTGWIDLNPDTRFIYDSLGEIARRLNGQFFDFDLWGFSEHMQYTVYNDKGGHYTWHLDRGTGSSDLSPRKLTLVLQLSDPEEYEGGDLEILAGPEPTKIDKCKGLVVAFPSFMLHRVTPVTAGIRKTLVVWLTGPRFK